MFTPRLLRLLPCEKGFLRWKGGFPIFTLCVGATGPIWEKRPPPWRKLKLLEG